MESIVSGNLGSQFVADLVHSLPITGWVVVAVLALITQIVFQRAQLTALLSVILLGALGAYSFTQFPIAEVRTLFFGSLSLDSLSLFFNLLIIFISFCVLLMSLSSALEDDRHPQRLYDQYPEFVFCLLLSGFGGTVATSAVDLTSFFIGFETLSIGLYGLCGFYRMDFRSTESAFKYLLVGAFSTVIMLFGLSMLYGATGSTNYDEIARVIEVGDRSLVLLGIVFLMAGFAFKMALVPFHLYTPDVYEGAPTPITAYLATVAKVVAIGAGIRIFWGLLGSESWAAVWTPLWSALCVASIVFGNLAALQQRSIKKLLAFSSISHAGFIGLGLMVAGPVLLSDGTISNAARFPLLAYLGIYSAMSLGLFALIHRLENRGDVFLLDDFKGLGLKRPGYAIAVSVFLLGMAGIPPLAGFIIKFWVLQEMILQGYLGLSILAVLGTLIGMGYYLYVLRLMFMAQDGRAAGWRYLSDRSYALRAVIFVAVLITVVGGLRPGIYADWIFHALGLK